MKSVIASLLMALRPPDIRLCAFDLDGTLVDAFPAITDSINHMMRAMRLSPQSLSVVKRSVGLGVENLVRCFVLEEDVPRALAIFREHHDARLRRNIRLLPGAKSLLPFLKAQGCVLAVATNRPLQFCQIILEALGVVKYFDHVLCGDMVARPKPYPDMLQEILRQSGIPASSALYVGDMTVDVACARAAGFFSVGVPTGSCTRDELEAVGPGMMVDRLSQVRGLFRK
ncbi:MAG: HAD-IA family hydrolase [Candidatus Omnitrophota bacterium]